MSRTTVNGEAVSLGLVFLFGLILAQLSLRFPAEMPIWAPSDFSWVEYLATVLALFWYARGLHRMPLAARPPLWKQIFFGSGVFLMYAVTQTAFTYVALHLFMATQAQQFVLHDFGPFLVALSWPGAVLKQGMPPRVLKALQARWIQAVVSVVQQPVVAAALFLLLLVAQVIPVVMFRIMLDWRLFDGMNILMVVEGLFFWCLVLDPRPPEECGISFLTRILIAFAVMLPVMPIGGYITFTTDSLYGFYDFCGRLPWTDVMNDQRMGGIIYWIPSGLMSSVAVMLPLNAMRVAEDAEERRFGKRMVQVGQIQIDPSRWTGR